MHKYAQTEKTATPLGASRSTLPDGANGYAKKLLREDEDVVPKAGLEVRLQLGHVEVGPRVALHEGEHVVEEVHAEVEQGPGERPCRCCGR